MKHILERTEIAQWRRIMVFGLKIIFLISALLLAPWLSQTIAGPWWLGFLILLIPLVALDYILEAVLLKPESKLSNSG